MKTKFSRESSIEGREPKKHLRKSSGSRPSALGPRLLRAFTLLEVMIASAIFFMALFSILALVSQSLRSAHSLSRNTPTPGMIAAELSLTNKLEEGANSGDFGDLYPGYDWTSDTFLYTTNGLFQVDFVVYRDGDVNASMSVLMFKPESTTGIGARSKFQR